MLISPAFFSRLDGEPPVLVAGGGPAGMHAALSLSGMGVPVLIVERSAHLGGQVMRLDKVYPTDHCAFCPVWTTAKSCFDSELINVLLHTEVVCLKTDGAQTIAELETRQNLIDPAECLFCGACADACTEGALLPRDLAMTWDPALPPAMRIDEKKCTRCKKCAELCPAGAIHFNVGPVRMQVAVSDVIYATGFQEPVPGTPMHAPEFGGGSRAGKTLPPF